MAATTSQKARLLDLVTGVLELVRDGNREASEVADVLQVVKEESGFAKRLLASGSVFPTWKAITLGTFRDLKDLRKALDEGGYRVSGRASDLLGQLAFKLAKAEVRVDLVLVTVAELGFKEGATYRDICVRAKELRLKLCQTEIGPQLRLQYYDDQPMEEWPTVAMEPITDSGGSPRLFRVGRDHGGRWLSTDWGGLGPFWPAGCRFVFAK